MNNEEDIVDVLLDQHRELRQLCADVQAATGGHKRRLFVELVALIHRHELGEQTVVHPVTRDRTLGLGNAVAKACTAEEERAGRAIAELQTLGVEHPAFAAGFEAFHQDLLDHAAHEERDEFPRLRQYVAAQRLYSMAHELRNVQAMS